MDSDLTVNTSIIHQLEKKKITLKMIPTISFHSVIIVIVVVWAILLDLE